MNFKNGPLPPSPRTIYGLDEYELSQIPGHEGGRNLIYICTKDSIPKCVLRLSILGDRKKEDYLAEAEFVHYLAKSGAPVADVIPSSNGNLVESFSEDGKEYFSIGEAARHYCSDGMNPASTRKNISRALVNNGTAYGMTWVYLDSIEERISA